MTDLFLSEKEIAALCSPLTQPSAQVRHLRSLGLTVTEKPNGRPTVVRSHAEAVLSGQRPVQAATVQAEATSPRPNVDGFMKVIQGGRRNGKKTALESA